MRILAVVPYIHDTAPGQRYRIEQWEPHLRRLGVHISYAPFESRTLNRIISQPGQMARKSLHVGRGMARRFGMLSRVRDYDAVYLYREAAMIGPPIIEKLMARLNVPIVYDFDDAIYLPPPASSYGALAKLRDPGKVKTITSLASHVMVGNQYLAEFARQNNTHVSIVPSTIDLSSYTMDAARPKNDVPVIGWSGSLTTTHYLDTIKGALQRLRKQTPFRFRYIGPMDYQIEGVEVESVRWRSQSEVEDLRPLDIGLMPMPDNQWAHGKCAMKALQYMAIGVPTVLSPIGVNADIIRDGDNGFLAADEDEWIEKLRRLIESPSLRHKVGMAGRATIEAEFSAAVQAPRIRDIFEQAIQSKL